MGPKLLTAREARDLLRVSPATLRAMLDRGELEGFRSGRITRVMAASVERLVGRPLGRDPDTEQALEATTSTPGGAAA
jgi:excisionase family DNA binding protein